MGRMRLAVIGGGISGLASALELSRRGHEVDVLEGSDVLGGLGTTFPYEDGHLERFYHCILPDDHALLSVIREVGLEDDLLWRRTDMGFMHGGKVYPLNTPVDLLRFSPLPLLDRVRMGLMGIRTRFSGLDPSLDGVGVREWLVKQVGTRAFNAVWRPLLEAKIGDGYAAIPALWLSSRMNREKSTKLEVKGCLRRGYRSLIDAIEATLRERGTTIRLDTQVARIVDEGTGMTVVLKDGSSHRYDAVVVTSPLVQFQQLAADVSIPSKLRELTLDYQGVVSAVFLLRKPLSRYYWMPIVDSGATAQGVIEMSNLVPLERSNGLYVTYFVNYTHRDSPLFKLDDATLIERYQQDLERLFPHAASGVVDRFLFRAPFVEPMWPLHYRDRRPAASVIPGRLYLSGTAQIYPRVNSWNSCCEVAGEMIEAFDRDMEATAPGANVAVA